MMSNLLLEEGGLLQVESASLPVASYAKFQPQSVDFLDITNPKAVYPLTVAKVISAYKRSGPSVPECIPVSVT